MFEQIKIEMMNLSFEDKTTLINLKLRELILLLKEGSIIAASYDVNMNIDFEDIIISSVLGVLIGADRLSEDDFELVAYLQGSAFLEQDNLEKINNNYLQHKELSIDMINSLKNITITLGELSGKNIYEKYLEFIIRIAFYNNNNYEEKEKDICEIFELDYELQSPNQHEKGHFDFTVSEAVDNIHVMFEEGFEFDNKVEYMDNGYIHLFSGCLPKQNNKDGCYKSIKIQKMDNDLELPTGIDFEYKPIHDATLEMLISQMEHNGFEYNLITDEKELIMYTSYISKDTTISFLATVKGVYAIEMKVDLSILENDSSLMDEWIKSIQYGKTISPKDESLNAVSQKKELSNFGVNIDYDRDFVTEMFVHDLNDTIKKEVNIVLQKIIPNLGEIVVPLSEEEENMYYNTVNVMSIPLSDINDKEVEQTIIETLTFLFPEKVFIRTNRDATRDFYHKSSVPIATDFGPENNDLYDKSIGINTDELLKEELQNTLNSIIIGEYEYPISDKEINKTSTGMFHEVTLMANGELVGRGSNETGQLDFPVTSAKVKDIYCGKLFTAILYENGKVDVAGVMGNIWNAKVGERDVFLDYEDFFINVMETMESKTDKYRDIHLYGGEITRVINTEINYDFHWFFGEEGKHKMRFECEDETFEMVGDDFERLNYYEMDFFVFKHKHRAIIRIDNDVIMIPYKNLDLLFEGAYLDHYSEWTHDIVKIEGSYDGIIAYTETSEVYINGHLS